MRELAILRVTAMAGSDFEFSHHFIGCQTVGVSAERSAVGARRAACPAFPTPNARPLCSAEAVDANVVPDALWRSAAGHFSARQLLDLAMTASFYGFASRLCNGLGVPADPDFRR